MRNASHFNAFLFIRVALLLSCSWGYCAMTEPGADSTCIATMRA